MVVGLEADVEVQLDLRCDEQITYSGWKKNYASLRIVYEV
jgi:hypothetical protein